MNSKFHIYILVALIILLIIIYIIHNRQELFTITAQTLNNPIVNLPANDIHFISDNNPDLIDIPVFNYKLKLNNNNNSNNVNVPIPSNINSHSNITETFRNTLINNQTEKYLSIFQHKSFNIYKGLGQYAVITTIPFNDAISAIQSVIDKKCLNYLTSSPLNPVGYNLIWTSDLNIDNKIFSVWSAIPPAGCVALGDIIIMGTEQPSLDLVACFPITMLDKTALSNGIIWKASNDMGKMCYCWGAGNIDLFKCSNNYSADIPELQSVYNLSTTVLNNNTVSDNMNKTLNNLQEHNKGITI
jgi:hypothetical protein